MELWLVREVPAWLVGIVLILGLPALVLALDVLIHRHLPHRRLDRHNDVTGVIVSLVGVAYAIVIGLCVVSLWDGMTQAEENVREEAVNLTALVPASSVFGAGVQRQITDEVVRYEEDLVADWDNRGDGPERQRVASLDRLATTVGALQPATEAQRAFVQRAVEAVGLAERFRQRARVEADDQRMSAVMWIGVLVSTAAILGMCLFFGLDDELLRRILLTLASAVIATNLFLIVEMNYPYYGFFSVSSASYAEVIAELRRTA